MWHAAATGLVKINAPLLKSDGTMKTAGGLPVPGSTKQNVYFAPDYTDEHPMGMLVRNRDVTIGGKVYRLLDNGAVKLNSEGMTTITAGDENYGAYMKKDGTFAVGRTAVKLSDGSTAYYYFDSKGRMERNVLRKTGNKWYYYGLNGQMTLNMRVLDTESGTRIVALCNKDGSIKCFNRGINDVQQTVKNIVIRVGNDEQYEDYVLGKDGLPLTGYVKMDVDNSTNPDVYIINQDGSTDRSDEFRLAKCGNSYYVVKGSLVQTDTSILYEVTDFSAIPAADQKFISKLVQNSGSALVLINPDGTVSAGKAVYEGVIFHKNKYGVVIEAYSCFIKSGKDWLISYDSYTGAVSGKAGSAVVESYACVSEDVIPGECVISWDSNGKISQVKDRATGKPLDGAYFLDFVDPHTHAYAAEMWILFKKGMPTGGKVKIPFYTVPLTYEFDSDGARCLDEFPGAE